MIDRRTLLLSSAALALTSTFGKADTMTTTTDIDWRKLSDAVWKKRLTPEQYYILRQHGTERAGTSPLNHEKRKGIFACAGCDLPLFTSEMKYESGTGWPSFFTTIPGVFGTKKDYALFLPRIEAKQRAKWGDEAWADFTARSSSLPFAAMLRGRARLNWHEIGWGRIAAAVALYLAFVLWLHADVIGVPVW